MTDVLVESIKVGGKKRGRKPKPQRDGIQGTKEYEDFLKTHDEEFAEAFLHKTNEELEKSIVHCTLEMDDAKKELEANPEYQKAKSDLDLLKSGLKEATKPLVTTVKFATLILQERGHVPTSSQQSGNS